MKLIVLFGDFGVGKTFISNILKSWYQNVYSLNIYDFISFRIFKTLSNNNILESNPYIEFLTYNNLFKDYKLKKFINDTYNKYDNIDSMLEYIYKNEIKTIKKPNLDTNNINIEEYPEFYSSLEFKKIVYTLTRQIADMIRRDGLQHNYIEFLLLTDFPKILSFFYKILDIIVYYGYSIKEFEILNNKFRNNIVFVENTNLTHINLVNDENKINVLLSEEFRNKMGYIKNKCQKRLINNLEFQEDLSNKIRSLLVDIPDFTRSF